MKGSLLMITMIILTGLLLGPALVYAESGQAAAGQAPISQPLVREGDLALKLADALGVGAATNEAEAEGVLAGIGIAPRNGWIADYPVTPDIVGELQSAVSDAADAKRLKMGKVEALKAFQEVIVAYNLSIKPSTADQYAENPSDYDRTDSTTIYNYYYDEGPPVVTYYAPPPDYYYLYTWVPYPFWWWDFWFPGFFILADFDIEVHGHHHDHHRGDHEFVTNHFRDPATGRMSRIDPANRTSGGTLPSRTGTGWSSPSASSGAQAIFNRSRGSVAAGNGMSVPSSGNRTIFSQPSQKRTVSSPAFTNGATQGAPFNGTVGSSSVSRRTALPSSVGQRMSNVSSANGRSFTPSAGSRGTFSAPPAVSRPFNTPSVGGRTFSLPSGGGRMFNGSSAMGRTFGSYSGGGRGSFGGWHR
jgi:hypothetical protein